MWLTLYCFIRTSIQQYGVNMAAEYLKAKNGGVLSKETRMWLEVIIPTFSVCCLLAITGWVTSDAIKVIQDHGADDDVGMYYTLLYTVIHTIHIHYTLCTIHYTLYTIHYTLYTIHNTLLYTIHYTLYTIQM